MTYLITHRWELVRETGDPSPKIEGPDDIARFLCGLEEMQSPQEHCLVIWLNTRNRIIGYDVVSKGTGNGSLVSPRDVFRGAILESAMGIIVAHNHPSGDVSYRYTLHYERHDGTFCVTYRWWEVIHPLDDARARTCKWRHSKRVDRILELSTYVDREVKRLTGR